MALPPARCAFTIALLAIPVTAPAFASAQLSPAPQARSINAFVAEAARRFAIPETWIYAVIRVESGGNSRAVSPRGATGLMQIMPSTWVTLRTRYGLGDDIYDAHDNIVAGAGYLREMYDRYGSPGFLAAYNAGPARYEDYRRNRRPLPAETVAYVEKLAPATAESSPALSAVTPPDPHAWARATLFIARADDGQSHAAPEPHPASTATTPDPVPAVPAAHHDTLFPPLSGHPAR
ncbi:MAG: transglycosylase SLT domain-containing protein [Sphingomonas sp.]